MFTTYSARAAAAAGPILACICTYMYVHLQKVYIHKGVRIEAAGEIYISRTRVGSLRYTQDSVTKTRRDGPTGCLSVRRNVLTMRLTKEWLCFNELCVQVQSVLYM